MAGVKRIIFAALSVLMIASVVAAEEQQCWTQVEPLWSCVGPRPDYGRAVSTLPSWAPTTARIVRATIQLLGGSANGGVADLGVDPDSVWAIASGWPRTQDAPFDRMVSLASVMIPPHQQPTPMAFQSFAPPVVFRPGDSIIVDYSCYGAGEIIMVWQICWIKP